MHVGEKAPSVPISASMLSVPYLARIYLGKYATDDGLQPDDQRNGKFLSHIFALSDDTICFSFYGCPLLFRKPLQRKFATDDF